jgi:hypothetical protein
MSFRRTPVRLALIVMLAASLLLAAAPTAFAATGEPTLGLAALQTKLDASPTKSLFGYMKTVLKGSTVETIPVEVLAITVDSPTSSLILFKAYGPKIDVIGGIASGMSGSPIYVEDDGVWKVVGALSYGDYFTSDGTGLATPIESMLRLITDYSPVARKLSSPVTISGRTVDRVIVSANPEKYSAASKAGAFVARPLASFFIGGLRPGSAAYERVASALAKHGISVARTGSAMSASGSSFSTELVPGAAVAALAARGDMWIGGIGTVTYTDGDDVLAYGHPAYWSGVKNLFMSNAWISGVWPNLDVPYKIGYPGAVKGAFVQDRLAGIAGKVGAAVTEVPLTAHVTNTDTGRTADTTVWASSDVLDTDMLNGLAEAAIAVAGYELFDTESIPGSANTTTTVVVSDGTREYTVVMPNLWNDQTDIVDAMTLDAGYAVDSLLSVLADGLETPHIVSVDLEASVTSDLRIARIIDVNALAPLRVGDNAVRVSMLAYGVAATQTIDATVTIPEEYVPLAGTLDAYCYNSSSEDSGDPPPALPKRPRISEIAAELNAEPMFNTLYVEFVPDTGDSAVGSDTSGSSGAAETSATAPWFLMGSASAQVTQITASAEQVLYGDDAFVEGEIVGPSEPGEVRVYRVPADGSAETLIGTGMSEWVDDTLVYSVAVSGITAAAEVRVAVDGGFGYTPAEVFTSISVRARVSLSATPRSMWRGSWAMLTASVRPRFATGTAKFQYYDAHNHKWRTLITKRLTRTSASARATAWWRPTIRGTYKVRVVYSGDRGYGGGVSPSVTIKVR